MGEHGEPLAELGNTQDVHLPAHDERAIRRKCYAAVTEADDLLRDLLVNCSGCDGWRHDIERVRGLLAEWRLESD